MSMEEIIIQTDRVISLRSIDGEEDLKPKKGVIRVNPPPADGKCNCCERHLNELKPFGKAGDPPEGNFDGALLVKTYRRAFPEPNAEIQEIIERFFGNCETEADYESADSRLIREYGKKDAEDIRFLISTSHVGASWECRDCIVLDMDEYFEKLGYDLDEYRKWKPRRKVRNRSHTRE
jgi:hypothetical protein